MWREGEAAINDGCHSPLFVSYFAFSLISSHTWSRRAALHLAAAFMDTWNQFIMLGEWGWGGGRCGGLEQPRLMGFLQQLVEALGPQTETALKLSPRQAPQTQAA